MKWTFAREGDIVYFQTDGEKKIVDKIGAGGAFYMVKVFLTGDEVKEVSLQEFDVECNRFSALFKEDVKSRTRFQMRWRDSLNTSDSERSSSLVSDGNLSSSPDVSGTLLLSEDDLKTVDEKSSASGVTNDFLKRKLLGTFDVHLDNLISPSSERKVRPLNYSHVTELEKSFMSNDMGQMMTLVGMVQTENVAVQEFLKPGSVNVEVLGGQHTVLALRSLSEKKLVGEIVRMTIYSPLDTSLALRLGLQHNIITETSRPMTFFDMVKLIRTRMPSQDMSKADVRLWKNDLLVIFGDKSIELLEGRLQNHIALARIEEMVWRKVIQAEELFGDSMQQTFFKDLISLPNEAQLEGMNCLITEGIKSFKAKMKEYRQKFPKRKRQKKNQLQKECVIQQIDEEESEATDSCENTEAYLEEIQSLKQEVEMLRDQLRSNGGTTDGPVAKKAKVTEDSEINVGDMVQTYWPQDGHYYEAEVLSIDTVYSVQYVMDRKKRKVTEKDIKRIEPVVTSVG